MSPLYPSLDAVGEALWDKVLAVNLKGPFRLAAMWRGDRHQTANVQSLASTARNESRRRRGSHTITARGVGVVHLDKDTRCLSAM